MPVALNNIKSMDCNESDSSYCYKDVTGCSDNFDQKRALISNKGFVMLQKEHSRGQSIDMVEWQWVC